MFVGRFGQTRIQIAISILVVIRHHKHILLIAIIGIHALASYEKHLFLRFLELMSIHQFGQPQIHVTISLSFVIRHHKHILLIGINDIEPLVSKENHLFLPFLELKFVFQLDKHGFT